MISEIVYKDIKEFNGYNDAETGYPLLKNLSRINLFIGSNNSGKSRFMRELFKNSSIGYNFKEFAMKPLSGLIQNHYPAKLNEIFTYRVNNLSNIPGYFKNVQVPFATQVGDLKQLESLSSELNNIKNASFGNIGLDGASDREYMKMQMEKLIAEVEHHGGLTSIHNIPYFNGEFIYVPMLRGLRPLDSSKETTDFYKLRTIKDYFKNELKEKRGIYTGQSLYTELKSLLLGDIEQREKVKAFEQFLSQEFFRGKDISLIPKITDDVVHVKIGTEERPVHELGDGIQSLIILLYPLFFNAGKQLQVFIEEPEHSLHPGLQRLFIETLHREEFDEFQFFITTHSNHFLDITEEIDKRISAYTFEKHQPEGGNQHFTIRNVSRTDLRSLEVLGVRSSSVFLSNCTIWVEGITDRLYISKFLEVYQQFLVDSGEMSQKFREDIHYSFIEYSGANLTHWSFEEDAEIDKIRTLSISKKIFLIADSDDTGEKPESAKAQRLNKLSTVLEDGFYKHTSREIENTLHENVLLQTIANIEKKEPESIKPKKYKQDDFSKSRIGKYIADKFNDVSDRYEGEGGALKGKKEFCKAAIGNIKSQTDLSPESIELCKKLIAFIKKSNSM